MGTKKGSEDGKEVEIKKGGMRGVGVGGVGGWGVDC